MWETIVVGLIVVAALLYTAWALLPATPRLRLARALAAWGQRPAKAAWIARVTAAIERAALKRVGGCSDCSAVQSAPGRPPGKRPDAG